MIERPIRERESVLDCSGETETDGVLVVIERPVRPCVRRGKLAPVETGVLLELVRLLERAAGCLAGVEVDSSLVVI